MLEVKVENILPVTEARDSFNQLIDKVEGSDEMFVMTKNGKPIAILVGVHHLEKLTGENHEELFGASEKAPVDSSNEAAKTDSTIDEPITEPIATTPAVDIPETPVAPIEPIAPATPAETPTAPTVADSSAPASQNTSPFTYDNVTTEQITENTAPASPPTPTADATVASETPAASDAFAVPNDPFATSDPTVTPASTTAADTNLSDNNQNSTANPTPAA